MTNEEAIKVLKANYPDACFEQLREAVDAAIEALETLVKSNVNDEDRTEDDLISRTQAIGAILAVTGNSSVRELYEYVQEHELSDMWSGGVNAAIDIIIAAPPVQPETHEKRTETHACDCISRQAAIEVLHGYFDGMLETDTWSPCDVYGLIEILPSAQPETAKRIVGKSRDGMTLWYQCDMCNEPVDVQDNFCRGCGRRLTDG